jgi:hypothetical protein
MLPPPVRLRACVCVHSRLRDFDPTARRAGLPPDVAALVEKTDSGSVTVTLANTNQLVPRTVIVQAGAYAEHRFTSARLGDREIPVNATSFTVRLAPVEGIAVLKRQVLDAGGVFQQDGQKLEAVYRKLPREKPAEGLPDTQLADAHLDGDLPTRGHAHELIVLG